MQFLTLPALFVLFSLSTRTVTSHDHHHQHQEQQPLSPETTKGNDSQDTSDTIPFSTRAHWMRRAILALSELNSPCPFAAFGTAIVNHTNTANSELGELVCIGANSVQGTGNPTLHGEVAAITNCSRVLTDPQGQYKLGPMEAFEALSQLSLYTTAEACPMCASAIRWSGFREYVYATSIDGLVERGWNQIDIRSHTVFEQSSALPRRTRLISNVLSNETDPLFSWQFDWSQPCPGGCEREESVERKCVPV